MLEQLEFPVTLQFYFSRSAEGLPIWFKHYGDRIVGLLRQYERQAQGRLRLEVLDPKPDSPEEDAALRVGLRREELATGEGFFFGLFAAQLDREVAIPLFSPQREPLLEYDISRLLLQVQLRKPPVVGILSSLDLLRPAETLTPLEQRVFRWRVFEELRGLFEVRLVETDEVPPEVDVLLVVHPRALREAQQFGIDQFLLSGKPVLVAVDPSSFYERAILRREVGPGGGVGFSSQMATLFRAWGVRYDERLVVGDLHRGSSLAPPGAGDAQPYPVWLELTEFPARHPVTQSLRRLLLPEVGSFEWENVEGRTVMPLLFSSPRSGEMMASILPGATAAQLRHQVQPDGRPHVLAALVKGHFQTAFPEGMPLPESSRLEAWVHELNEASRGRLQESREPGLLVLLADVDFLADDFALRLEDDFGMPVPVPANDNHAFFLNLVDMMAGHESLLALRGKDASFRPFDRVVRLEQAAADRFRGRLAELEARLASVRGRLADLERRWREGGDWVLSEAWRQEVESFRLEEAQVRGALREIRAQLRTDIERLHYLLASLNLLVAPGLVCLAGVVFFVRRARRGK